MKMFASRNLHARDLLRSAGPAALMLIATLCLQVSLATSAEADCPTTFPSQSGAHTSSQTTIYGASAEISYHNPVVCNDTGKYSEGWAMVSAPNDGHPDGTHKWYMQIGYKERLGFAPQEWAAWVKSCSPNCSGLNYGSYYGSNVSSAHTYAVFLVSSTQRLRGTIDGDAIPDGPTYNPADYWDSHWSADFAAEVHDCASDIIGVPDDKVHFDHIKRYNGDGTITWVQQFADEGAQIDPSCPSIFNYQAFTPNVGVVAFKTWTG